METSSIVTSSTTVTPTIVTPTIVCDLLNHCDILNHCKQKCLRLQAQDTIITITNTNTNTTTIQHHHSRTSVTSPDKLSSSTLWYLSLRSGLELTCPRHLSCHQNRGKFGGNRRAVGTLNPTSIRDENQRQKRGAGQEGSHLRQSFIIVCLFICLCVSLCLSACLYFVLLRRGC